MIKMNFKNMFKEREKFEPEFQPETKENKEKGVIESIENSPLDYQDKGDFLLLYLKEKPASFLTIVSRFYKIDSAEKKEKDLKKLSYESEKIQEILEKLEMPNIVKKFEVEEEKTISRGYHFLVGQDSEKLNCLKKALESGCDEEIGLALGYPETAVRDFDNNFEKQNLLDYDELRKSLPKEELKNLQREGVLKFLNFRLSKDHWRDELEIVRKYQRLIKEKSSKIYNKIVKEALDPLASGYKLKIKFQRVLNKLEYYKRSFKK